MVIFHSYVSLPEGMSVSSHVVVISEAPTSRCNLRRGTAMVKHHGFFCPIKSHHSNGWISWHPIGAKWNAGLSNIMNSCNPLTSVLWTRTYQFQVAMCCSCLLLWCTCLMVWYWSSHKLMWEFKSSERVSCHTGPIGPRHDLIQSVLQVLWVGTYPLVI